MRRNLTVSTLRRQWGPLYRMQTAYVPAIRLNGNWLADAGFTPGNEVTVSVQQMGFPSQPGLVIQQKAGPQ